MPTRVYWNAEPLKARLRAALPAGAEDVKRAAQARAKSHIVRAGMRVIVEGTRAVVVAPTKLARFQESGTHAHSEQPKGQAMKFKKGGFARGTIEHPGAKADPFLMPAAALFPEFYNRWARRFLA